VLKVEEIKQVAIHPAIGIARVGNAPDGYFLAPEVPGEVPVDPDDFRDADGRIKRQAVRFRIYATLKSGEVREVTANDCRIEWRVEIANLKAGWYEFNNAMDLPANLVMDCTRRNPDVTGLGRASLDIRPSAISISGRDVSGPDYRFDNGRFHNRLVYLGELRTDSVGRLIFLGGQGISNPRVPGTKPTTFANNHGWHDDVSDGPVRATLTVDGQSIEAEPAFVVTAPPNYAPGLYGCVTMDDVVRNTFADLGWLTFPDEPSFTQDIWPIFDRMSGNQWVNSGIYGLLGHGSLIDARDPTVIAKLADASSAGETFRQNVFELFRLPDQAVARNDALPPFYGDTFGDFDKLGRADLSVLPSMYQLLAKWAAGDFVADWAGFPVALPLENLPLEAQPEVLDRAGLYDCLGGPFHPGIELTWTMRWPGMWKEKYRLHILPEGMPVRQDYGDRLTRSVALAVDGPHAASGPGSLTRWMGIPWQTDEASCDSGGLYTPSRYLSSPSFWGARVPNQVLSRLSFELLGNTAISAVQRQKHFNRREVWTRDINGRNYLERIANMVEEWWEIGIVIPETGPPDAASVGMPEQFHVETGRSAKYTGDDPTLDLLKAIENLHQTVPTAARAGLAPSHIGITRERKPPFRQYGRGDI
jgi:L-Lysine epsilon oxidase N-terminal/L-lysine epsilon oxidase C-terminal domain